MHPSKYRRDFGLKLYSCLFIDGSMRGTALTVNGTVYYGVAQWTGHNWHRRAEQECCAASRRHPLLASSRFVAQTPEKVRKPFFLRSPHFVRVLPPTSNERPLCSSKTGCRERCVGAQVADFRLRVCRVEHAQVACLKKLKYPLVEDQRTRRLFVAGQTVSWILSRGHE